MQLLSMADSSKLVSHTQSMAPPPGLGMRLVTVQFCSEHEGVETGYLESESSFHNLSMNSTAVDIVGFPQQHLGDVTIMMHPKVWLYIAHSQLHHHSEFK